MKEYLNGLYKEYSDVQGMTESECMREYDAPKAEILADYEREIDWYENEIYNKWYYGRNGNLGSVFISIIQVLW